MTRVVYFFASISNAAERRMPWNPKNPTRHSLAMGIETEGFWYLWKKALEARILDEVLIVIESARSPGVKEWWDGFKLYVVPHIDQIEPYLRPDDIFFVRSGFRSWFEFLKRIPKRWTLFYRAASQRQNWPFWDITFEDLTDKSFVADDRLYYQFHKPISPDVFKFWDRVTRDIDVMFHASHIHDKKGQWKCVDAMIAYREMYGKHLIACMPGRVIGGERTQEALVKIKEYGLPIWQPGMIPRGDVCRWMNRCKLYIHLGGAGQNDRGNLESMICGCQQIIGNQKYHPPFVYEHPEISTVIQNHAPDAVAACIHDMLGWWKPSFPEKVAQYYQEQNRVEVALGELRRVIEFIKANPVPDRSKAIKELM